MPRTFRRRRPSVSQAVVIVVLLLLVAFWRWQTADPPAAEAPNSLAEGTYTIRHVVDGDTLLLEGGRRVRLLGVDTPESVKHDHPVEPWGPEASDFAKRFLADGTARLQFDREKQDDYGRYLAYVYATDAATGREQMLNEELLRAGLGHALLRHPYSEAMKRKFQEAEQEARNAKRGIWSEQSD